MTRARRRPSPLVLLLALLAAGGVVAAVLVVGGSPAATNVSRRTATAAKGVVETVVSGTGNLAPSRQLDLQFGTSGTVQKVYVKAGQHVVDGQVLARLDETTADVQLQQARAQLGEAEDQLRQAQEAAANTTASSSEANTATSTASSSAEPVAIVTAAKATPTATPTPRSGGSSGSSSAASVPSAEAAVASAQLSVRQAEDAVEGTILRAPMAGVVASVSGSAGDQVGGSSGSSSASATSSSSSSPSGGGSSGFVTLVNLHRLTMQVQLSEADIADVRVGQPATVTIDALPGTEVAAHVRSIGVLSSSSSSSSGGSSPGAVSYPVTLVLDQKAAHLRPGMSASADVVTARARGVVVPSGAVRGSTVTVVRGGKQVSQRVEVGVTGDSSTQILSGVKAGQQVVVTSTTATAGRIAQAASKGSARSFGGGAGFGGGLGSGGPRLRLRTSGTTPGGFGGGGP